jgi:hypothetical protein
MKKLLFLALVVSVHMSATAADDFSTPEERMSGREFMAAGLGKLTDEELAALNDWIRRHSVATLENATRPASVTTPSATAEDMRGFENRKRSDGDNGDIHGVIDGTFSGWKEKGTLFKLTNGMVWQQTEEGTFYVKPTENAEIVISKGFMNNWQLSMVGYGTSVRVKRIK